MVRKKSSGKTNNSSSSNSNSNSNFKTVDETEKSVKSSDDKQEDKQSNVLDFHFKISKKMLVGFIIALIIIIGIFFAAANINSSTKTGVDDEGYFKGAKDARLTIIEWSDFECPFCGKFYAETLSQIEEEYINTGKVKLVFKHFPLEFHANAQKAAEAAECAGEQGKFWEMHDMMFENQNAIAASNLKSYAKDLGLNTAKFDECLDSGKYAEKIKKDMNEGSAVGISGTPGFQIKSNTVKELTPIIISGAQPFANFKQVIDQMLEGKQPSGDAPEQETNLQDSSNDPEVEMIVVTDKTCSACNIEPITAINEQGFKTVKEKVVDVSSDEGKKLVKEYEINVVPFFIYNEKITKTVNFKELEPGLVEKNNKYYIDPVHYTDPRIGVGVKVISLPDTSKDHATGSDDASVTIIEFSDFECPFCGKFYTETLPELKKQYIETGKVKLVFKHLPLSFHANAQKAAEAAECAGEQGKFWEMHDMIFENQNAIAVSDLKSYANNLDLETDNFDSCVDSGKFAEKINRDKEIAESVGIGGTPGFLINGIQLSGAQPFANFDAIIKAELKE